MASKKKLKKNLRCHSGYNFSDEKRYTTGKYLSYSINGKEDDYGIVAQLARGITLRK